MTAATQRERDSGVLYVVATPIGNLRDITLRALEVLAEVDLIACEDTRHTAQLLAAHNIRRPLISYFEHNEQQRAVELVGRLHRGDRLALVTDAGTPCISDPGYRLVRAALDAGFPVRAVPGPCAAIAALAVAGIPTDRFVFEGFLPSRPAARDARLRELAGESRTLVFYEAARRLAGTLAAMAALWDGQRTAAVVRELTKLHEETVRGSLSELIVRAAAAEWRGEVVLLVAGAPSSRTESTEAGKLTVRDLIEAGLEPRTAAKLISRATGRNSREVYAEAVRDRRGPGGSESGNPA
jgi:16S rRNA (cytidine1402-2'-O)-methyltransferase